MNRAKVIADIRARRALLKATGHLSRRRRMPRQQQPKAIRVAYFGALLRGPLAALQDLTKSMLAPVMPGLLAAAAAERGDSTARLDATAESVGTLMGKIADAWFAEWPNERLAEVAKVYGTRTSDMQRRELARQFKAALGIDVLQTEPWLAPKVAGFTAENVSLIRSVARRYFDEVETRVMASLRTGQRWEDLAVDLEDRLGVSESRAKLIARDQVGKLYGDLNRTRQQQLGVTRYRWRTMNDNRVRDDHAEREGVEYSWDDPPEDGHPGEPVNCRCNADPILDELLGDLNEPTTPAPASAPPPDELPLAALPGATVRG